jgi:fused signal recognition particle receptor
MFKWFRKIDQLLTGAGRLEENVYEGIEELLIQADVSISTTERLIKRLKEIVEEKRLRTTEEGKQALREAMVQILQGADIRLRFGPPPSVFLLVGVNGTGKTTSLAKLAYWLIKSGHRVLIAAADTFRAGAIDQLETWAKRVGAETIRHQPGSDPSAVLFDALHAAQARKVEVLLADTAGRLHTKSNLMEELRKMGRVVERENHRPADEVLLVLDATTGQNAINQAKEFSQVVPISGIILTKVDGTAKGGVAFTLREEMGLPIKFLGTGERLEDLEIFNPQRFVERLFE